MKVPQYSYHPRKLSESFCITLSLWSQQTVHGEVLIQYRPRCSSGSLDPSNWFDIIDEASILTVLAANRASLTLQSISAHDRIEFDGKLILFLGNIRQLYPWFPISRCLRSIASSQVSLIGPQFEKFAPKQPMKSQDPVWNSVLLSFIDGQTHNA
jgi:hypothetical protein